MTFDPSQLVHPQVRELMPYQPGKPISELQRELGINDIIKLASNENPLGASPLALAAAEAVLMDTFLYPDPNGFQLKTALAEKLGVTPEQITLGNGSDAVLAMIAQAFLHPGEEVVISQYAFATFSIITRAMRGTPVIVPTQGYHPDLEAMAATITDKTKLIFIANPNNPTGTWINNDQLTAFLAKVPQRVLVVLDEAYYEFMDDPDYPNTIALQQTYSNLVVTRTFSKIYGLAGLRVGYSIASAEISDYLNRVRLPFNVSAAALAAAEAALTDQAFLQQTLELNRQGMIQLGEGLTALGLDYIPSAGNFITVDIQRDGGEVFEKMLAEGVIVRPLKPYGLNTHLRISIGTEAEIERCLTILTKILEG